MPEIWDVVEGFIIMVGFIILGLMLSYLGGTILDQMYTIFTGLGIDAGVGTAYDSSSQMNLMINIYYAICYALPLLGILNFGFTLVRRSRQDVVTEELVRND